MADIESLLDHKAKVCACGSVHFNLLESGKTECAQCQKREFTWACGGQNADQAA